MSLTAVWHVGTVLLQMIGPARQKRDLVSGRSVSEKVDTVILTEW